MEILVHTPRGLRSPYRRNSLPDGRGVLSKVVEVEHELIAPPGVAVDVPVLDAMEREGLAGVAIYRAKTDAWLWAPLERWRRGIRICRGFGEQRVLRWSDLEPLPSGEQMALFAS